ncbi:hypothetical protein M514_04082, partial [Trichuris suis]
LTSVNAKSLKVQEGIELSNLADSFEGADVFGSVESDFISLSTHSGNSVVSFVNLLWDSVISYCCSRSSSNCRRRRLFENASLAEAKPTNCKTNVHDLHLHRNKHLETLYGHSVSSLHKFVLSLPNGALNKAATLIHI